MKFEFAFIGKTSDKYLATGMEHYLGKLGHYVKSEIRILPQAKGNKQKQLLKEEAISVLKLLSTNDCLILLDERGKQFTSIEFSKELQYQMNHSFQKIIFVTGSAYGVDESVRQRANLMLSFSKFTLTHQMIRLVLLEQVYRAMTIWKGESYHHE